MLPSGGSHSWPIALDSESLLSYRVEADGGNVDIYLMISDDYEHFKLGEKYTYIADGSFENVPSASAEPRPSCQAPIGSWPLSRLRRRVWS